MYQENLIQYLQKTLPMPFEKAIQIAETFQQRDIPKNIFMIEAGKVCSESHFIIEGCARMYTFDTNGNDVTTALYSKNMFANDFYSFFKRIPSSENMIAMTDCKTLYISYEQLQINFHTIPEFREFGRMLLINNHAILKERMLSMIQQTGEQRYGKLITTNPEIFQHIPLKNIASYLGVTDTSLSRIRKEFSRK
jgi:CRP-like cAMP-binding protein